MKKLALVSVISLVLVFAYAFTPSTTVVNSELNSISIVDDTIKSTKSNIKKTNKKYKSDCSSRCNSHLKKKCGSSKDLKKKKDDKK